MFLHRLQKRERLNGTGILSEGCTSAAAGKTEDRRAMPRVVLRSNLSGSLFSPTIGHLGSFGEADRLSCSAPLSASRARPARTSSEMPR